MKSDQVLILGGYGNFGRRIATSLSKAGISVIIAGRNKVKAQNLAGELGAGYAVFDVNTELEQQLKTLKPKVVINTCGPFQLADYNVAKTCIANNINYIDLADGRDFVCGISALNTAANENGILVVSGASTVPGLSSAVIENFKDEFSEIDSLLYGISPGQKASRGLATTQGILTYLGKRLKPAGNGKIRYGWQDIYRQHYPKLGPRWMANCDIPDLDLFPQKYGIRYLQFSAGMENTLLHLSIWAVSWLIRLGLPVKMEKHASSLLKLSHWFDRFGTADGGMHVILKGKNNSGQPLVRKWFIIAKNGDGPQIPCIPAIILAKKIVGEKLPITGAKPCVGLVTLEEYLDELKSFEIEAITV